MRSLSGVCLVMLTLACAGPSRAQPSLESPADADASADPAEPSKLVSVRPGVNDRYFEEDSAEPWVERLEGERREVIAHRDGIVAALELRPGLRVADIGAGTGAFLAKLSAGVGAEGKVYAVDIVPTFLDHLRERAASEGLTNVEVVEATPTEVQLDDASVDLMFMSDVYHHIEYPAVYLRSLHAALTDEGRLVIVEFDKVPGKTTARMMKHIRQDKATLLAELAEAGFELEREIDDLGLDENYMVVFHKARAL